MNLDHIEDKLNNIKKELTNESYKLNQITKNLSNQQFDNPIDKINIKNHYYSTLDFNECLYQQKNDEYKNLISNYSQAYLDICDFYVGPELSRETFLDSKHDINLLYFMFVMSLFLK